MTYSTDAGNSNTKDQHRELMVQMRKNTSSATSGTQLNATTIAVIITSVSIVVVGLFIALIFMLIRAVRIYKRLQKDLQERGLSRDEAQKETGDDALPRSRDVLQRSRVLPFNNLTGWSNLPSSETIKSSNSQTIIPYYVPQMPEGPVKKRSTLKGPFSSQGSAEHAIEMTKSRDSTLSTVIESPQSSLLVPMLDSQETVVSSRNSLVPSHPAFGDAHFTSSTTENSSSLRTQVSASETSPHRAESIAELSSLKIERPKLRVRSSSLCGQWPGKVPGVILPPLPLDISRIKVETKKRTESKHMTSKHSISSSGTIDSTILTARPSPVNTSSTQTRGQKLTKPNAKGSAFARGRIFRDSLDLRMRTQKPRYSQSYTHTTLSSISSTGTSRFPADRESPPLVAYQLPGTGNTHHQLISPVISHRSVRTSSRTKYKSRTLVSSTGSPGRQINALVHSNSMPYSFKSPRRQHSYTSSRSSGGNPFQWDPAPLLSSAGKPSALKGSPSCRKGHRRKNSVRISLVPTVHGIGSPTLGPSVGFEGSREHTPEPRGVGGDDGDGRGEMISEFPPSPPASATFEPNLRACIRTFRATPNQKSPSLPLVEYDRSFVVYPTDTILPQLSQKEQKRLSSGSIFNSSALSDAHAISVFGISRLREFSKLQPLDMSSNFLPSTPFLPQIPFEVPVSGQQTAPGQFDPSIVGEYHPKYSKYVDKEPSVQSMPMPFKLACVTVPEELPVESRRVLDVSLHKHDVSPPVSPKTVTSPKFTFNHHVASQDLRRTTDFPKGSFETIGFAVPSTNNDFLWNSSQDNTTRNSQNTSSNTCFSAANRSPPTPTKGLVLSNKYGPLIIGRACLERNDSDFSLQAPSPSSLPSSIEPSYPVAPSSPRPVHAKIPFIPPSINFADLPRLSPSPQGSRGSQTRPLQSSIVQLRRMNSEIAIDKDEETGRGEKRYLDLGRDEDVQSSGHKSWLHTLEDDEDDLDDNENQQLIGDLLDNFDEGFTTFGIATEKKDASTRSSAKVILKQGQVENDEVNEDTQAGALSPPSRSAWEAGVKFWSQSSNQARSDSPTISNEEKIRMLGSSSCPCSPSSSQSTASLPHPKRKRGTEHVQEELRTSKHNSSLFLSHSPYPPPNKPKENHACGVRYRKRNLSKNATTNVKIRITTPGGSVLDTPGSLYDSKGFLRV